MQLEIVEEREGRVPVLRLLGPLDVATADQLRERIIALLERDVPAVAVDLAQVAFVDSSGMGALLGGKKRALERNIDYYLLDCPAPLASLLNMVGLDRVIDFCARRELAQRFPPEETALPGIVERRAAARASRRA
jgi:anti-sigma B factor antagonist